MMRKIRKTSRGHDRVNSEPLVEPMIDAQGRRAWSRLTNDGLVAYTKKFMRNEGISGRRELWKADSGLYDALIKRERNNPGIMDGIGFEKKIRDWTSMSDDAFVGYVKAFMKELGITGKKELKNADAAIYQAVRNREKRSPGIIDRIGFKRKIRRAQGQTAEEFK